LAFCKACIPALTAFALAACATTPQYRERWAVFEAEPGEGNATKLVYGVPNSDLVDLFAVCDRDAKVFELAFFAGEPPEGVKSGTRTELIVGPPDALTPLMASVQIAETGEMLVVARTGLPPEFVRRWAGERVTVAGQGVAVTLLARPGKAMLEQFLARCAA
jgi:hypothetical protein